MRRVIKPSEVKELILSLSPKEAKVFYIDNKGKYQVRRLE